MISFEKSDFGGIMRNRFDDNFESQYGENEGLLSKKIEGKLVDRMDAHFKKAKQISELCEFGFEKTTEILNCCSDIEYLYPMFFAGDKIKMQELKRIKQLEENVGDIKRDFLWSKNNVMKIYLMKNKNFNDALKFWKENGEDAVFSNINDYKITSLGRRRETYLTASEMVTTLDNHITEEDDYLRVVKDGLAFLGKTQKKMNNTYTKLTKFIDKNNIEL